MTNLNKYTFSFMIFNVVGVYDEVTTTYSPETSNALSLLCCFSSGEGTHEAVMMVIFKSNNRFKKIFIKFSLGWFV